MIPQINLLEAAASIIALMIAIIGHEIMHGYIAYRYGDTTAKNAGRLNINPLVHIDLVGSILVPLVLFLGHAPFLFGWAKPVPVNMMTVLQRGGYGAAIAVSLAGIIYNLFCACIVSVVFPLFVFEGVVGEFVIHLMIAMIMMNVVLAVFNLWPIPPLDGSNALRFWGLSRGWRSLVVMMNKLDRYGMIILILILATPLSAILLLPAQWILSILLPF